MGPGQQHLVLGLGYQGVSHRQYRTGTLALLVSLGREGLILTPVVDQALDLSLVGGKRCQDGVDAVLAETFRPVVHALAILPLCLVGGEHGNAGLRCVLRRHRLGGEGKMLAGSA